MRNRLYLVLLLGGLLFGGCRSAREAFGPLTGVEIQRLGSAGIDLTLELGNASRRDLRLQQGEFTLYRGEEFLMQGQLHQEALLQRRTPGPFRSRWKISRNDPAAPLLLQRRLESQSLEDLRITYRLTLKWGGVQKTFSAEMVPLSDFLRTFGPLDS